jgi:CDP-3, 6-dideoxy-D-glycero-L-glycero-4-hexulose-4-reductase
MQNILITGATGFIGKHLTKRLSESNKYNITALIRQGSDLNLLSNIQNKIKIHYYTSNYSSINELFEKTNFDYVFHLAAFSIYDHQSEEISEILDSNIKLGTFILEAMHKYGCQYFINTSTYWQNYHNQTYQPICLYAASKKAFEDIIEYYCMDEKITAMSLKLYDVYGYQDHRNKLLNTLIKEKDRGRTFDLSPGEQKLYMVFIDDVIDAYLKAMELIKNSKKHNIYSIFGKEKFSLKEIVKIAEESIGHQLNINWAKKSYYTFQIMDPFTENKLQDWEAKISLKEGIKIILNKETDDQ